MQWIATAGEALLYFSVVTLGEIRKGIAAPEAGRRAQFEAWLSALPIVLQIEFCRST
jgi:hypothetical protein